MSQIKPLFINHSKTTFPKKFMREWLKACEAELKKNLNKSQQKRLQGDLVVIFLETAPARKLNRIFRGRDYATDVLSFSSEAGLGELVLCSGVLIKQAKEHQLSLKEELGYLVLHGILHLLGFEHEISKAKATKMYALQDQIFAKLQKRFF